jgi:hypothetical protein
MDERRGSAVALDHVRSRLPTSAWSIVPGARDLRHYDRAALRPDLVAAVSVAAVAVPASLGMAELAGLPVVVGLYATMLPLTGYALFGSSRQLIVGPEGALAALTAVTIAPLAGGDPERYAALAAALALVMGVVLVLGGLLHLGFMADFFSKPVLLGYINGTALTIIASQLGKLLGVSVSEQDFFPILREVVVELGDVDSLTVLVSTSLLGLAFVLRRVAPKVPATLVVVVGAIAASLLFDLEERGVAVVGAVEGGLPPLGLPDVSLSDLRDLLLPACAFALIAFADTIGSARAYAVKNGYEVDPNRELAGLGGANLSSGVSAAFPVSASGSPATSSPSVRALPGEKESMPAIHFGISDCTPGAGRLRHCFAAISRKKTPTASFPHEIVSLVVSSVAASPASATKYATALRAPMAKTQPARNMGPLTRARAENSIRMPAMIGVGLIATPIAYVSTALMPSATAPPRREMVGPSPPSHARRDQSSVFPAWSVPVSRSGSAIRSGSRSYVQGRPEGFQPFFRRMPWKTLSGSSTRLPSIPSRML